MTNPNTYNTACMTGVIDNVDFTRYATTPPA